ncbi:MAG: M20 family peptidase, partial [Cytophagaceae bacterium]
MKQAILFVFLISSSAFSQTLSTAEKNILATVRKQQPETEAFLEKVVNINSGTLNQKGVKTVGDMLRAEFDKIQFTTEWLNMPDSVKRAGHLVASVRGKKGKRL